MKDIRERYLTDATFRYVVESMRAIVNQALLTPSEVREAAMLACILEEERKPFTISMSEEEMDRLRRTLRKPAKHAPTCPAYGNFQPPYEDCTCGAER